MLVDRVESGIPGLDKLIQGGFVKGSVNLLAGQTGTGKTIFGMQYLLHGLKKGEKALYISLEQGKEDVLSDVSSFGWDAELKKFISQGKLLILSLEPTSIEDLSTQTIDAAKKVNASRLVLDSLSVATMGWKMGELDVTKLRSETFSYIKSLKSLGLTGLLITEIPEEKDKSLSRFGFEEFLADGVIVLSLLDVGGDFFTNIRVRKMRRTKHKKEYYPFEITTNGLKLLSKD